MVGVRLFGLNETGFADDLPVIRRMAEPGMPLLEALEQIARGSTGLTVGRSDCGM